MPRAANTPSRNPLTKYSRTERLAGAIDALMATWKDSQFFSEFDRAQAARRVAILMTSNSPKEQQKMADNAGLELAPFWLEQNPTWERTPKNTTVK